MKLPRNGRAVCERIAAGESLVAICADPAMPIQATVNRWLANNPDFAIAFAQAQRLRAHGLAVQMIEIADGLSEDAGEEEARRGRLRIDARKSAMSHLAGVVVPAREIPPSPVRISFCSPSDFVQKSAESRP